MARVAIDLGETAKDSGTALPELGDFLEFAAAGSNASGEFRCADCGYGAVIQQVLPPCPMCRGTVWERREPRAAQFPT